MTTVSPPAVRLRRPGWRDPRLLGGLVLVALSVALGGYAVAAAGRTVPVLATPSALVPGDEVDLDALVVRQVRLAEAGDLYLRADRPGEGDLVAVRTVGPGEIVPRAALAPAAALDVRSVSVTSRAALSEQVVPGASVDLWFVPDAGAGDPAGRAAPARDRVDRGGGLRPRWGVLGGWRGCRPRAGPGRPAARGARGAGRRRVGRGRPRRRGGAVTAVLCAVRGPGEAAVVRALTQVGRLSVARRCADLAELLSAAAAGLGRVVVVSADLPGLDREGVRHLHGSRAWVVLLVDEAAGWDDERAARLGADVLVPADRPDAVAEAVGELAGRGERTADRPAPPAPEPPPVPEPRPRTPGRGVGTHRRAGSHHRRAGPGRGPR